MPGLSTSGSWRIYYNGYDFGVMTAVTAVNVRPNLDSAGRTVVSTTHTYTVESHLTPESAQTDTDSHLTKIRKYLTPSGGELITAGLGFSDLHVNDPAGGGVRDLAYGPHTRALNFVQEGSNRAWKLVWTVETTVLDQCSTGTYSDSIMEFNYRLTFTVDRLGFTTRVFSGFLKIPAGRATVGDRTLHDNADRYLEQALPPPAVGFRRETRQRDLDEAKTKLTFTVTDTEFQGYAPPPGVVVASLTFSSSTSVKGFTQWVDSARGRYTTTRTVPRAQAFKLFWDAVIARVNASSKEASFLFPLTLSLDSGDLYGPEAGTFTFTYSRTMSAFQLAKAIRGAALWQPPPVADAAKWMQSMANAKASAPRGYAGLAFGNNEDRLVDLCEGKAPGYALSAGTWTGPTLKTSPDVFEKGEANPFNLRTPLPGESWLGYEHQLVVQELDNVSVLQTMPLAPPAYTAPPGGYSLTTGYSSGYPASNATTNPAPIVQTRGSPLIIATLIGYALRIAFPIPAPAVTAIAGVPAVPLNDGRDTYKTQVVANLGLPVVAASWARRYVLAGVPTNLMPPADPFQGSVGDDGLKGYSLKV